MRALLFTLASLAAAGTAGASSIEKLTSDLNSDDSIARFSCAHCPPRVVLKKNMYIVPEISPGTERTELKEINGEMKMVRTEAWLGGSPVVFISKASQEDVKAAEAKMQPRKQPIEAAATAETPAEVEAAATTVAVIGTTANVIGTTANVIDTAAKTGSLDNASMADMAAVTPQDSHSQEVDLENFQLRLK